MNINYNLIKNISGQELLYIVELYNQHYDFKTYEKPIITKYENKLIPNTIFIEYHSIRKDRKGISDKIKLYFNYKKLTLKFIYENDESDAVHINKYLFLNTETLNYLIDKKYIIKQKQENGKL